jgi:hypothetical protein
MHRAHYRPLHRRRTGAIDLTPPAPVAVPYAPPSPTWRAIDQVCRAAEAAGWPSKVGFEASMHLRAAGIDPVVAVEAFEACRKWTQ